MWRTHILKMVKINGFFETFLDKELYNKLQKRSKVIRVNCIIKFKTKNGFSEPYPAIIDTGAHTSVIPLEAWQTSEHQIFGEHHIAGLVPGVIFDVKVGELTGILADVINVSKEHKFLCYFSPNDSTPLILGFKELLEHFEIVIDYKENIITLEEKD